MTIEKRLKRIVERKFPAGGMCQRLKNMAMEAQKSRLEKMKKEIVGLSTEEVESKIKNWEAEA